MPCCGSVARRQRCARVAGVLLTHVNILLVLFSGAGLATAARLKWDPSAYVPVREALPREYRPLCALLLLGALALLALALAGNAALTCPPSSALRRPLLYSYAALMTALVAGQAGVAGWAAHRALQFLRSPAAARLQELLQVRDHLRAAFEILARLIPLPDKINDIIAEAEADLPRNGYVAGGAALALLLLQTAGAALALLAAAPPRAPAAAAAAARASPRTSTLTLASVASAGDYARPPPLYDYNSEAGKTAEEAPLRTAFKHGRLVVL